MHHPCRHLQIVAHADRGPLLADPSKQGLHKYMTTVRPDAPWCPSNLEFIRRINDLPDEQAVWVFGGDQPMARIKGGSHRCAEIDIAEPHHQIAGVKHRRKTRWASAERICAFTAWKARVAISLSAAPCRCVAPGCIWW
jgi:hypothetical protein